MRLNCPVGELSVKGSHCILWIGLALAAGAVEAAAELRLEDGQVLRGSEVKRDGDVYLLQREAGEVLTIPVALVAEVRLIAAAPSALRYAEPEVLVGETVSAPLRSRQLEALGKPSAFARNVIDPQWQPKSDWEMDPVKNNNFAPSKWTRSVIEYDWKPVSAFDAQKQVLAGSQSTFRDSIIDTTWHPSDGFEKKKRNPL